MHEQGDSSKIIYPPDLHDSQILTFKCVFKVTDVIREEGGVGRTDPGFRSSFGVSFLNSQAPLF